MNIKTSLKSHQYINKAILLFCISSLLYNSGTMQMIGYVFLIISLLIFGRCVFNEKPVKIGNGDNYKICVIFISLLFVLELIRNLTFRAIEILACFYIALIVFHAFSKINLNSVNAKRLKKILFIEILIIYIPLILGNGFSPIDGGYSSIYTTTTFLGFFACLQVELCLLLYYLTRDRGWILLIILFIFLVYLSRVRTAYVGIIIVLLTFIFRRIILTRKKNFFNLLKCFFVGFIFAFVFIYPQLDKYDWYNNLDAFIYNYTGKILLTGRNQIWVDAFQHIYQSPYWGYGLDTSFFKISMHNSYLQIILESGIVGMIGIIMLINIILNHIIRNNGEIYKMIFIFSLVNLLLATTEVMLFHGQMILEVIVWMIMGIGVNRSLNMENFNYYNYGK